MTASFRFGTGAFPFVGSESTGGIREPSPLMFKIDLPIIAAGTPTTFSYTGVGTIKGYMVQIFTNTGVIRSTVNVDTFVLDATGKTITYTPQTNPTVAGYAMIFAAIGL